MQHPRKAHVIQRSYSYAFRKPHLQIKGIDIHSSPDRPAGLTSPTDAETLSAQPRFKTPSDTVSRAVVRRDASGTLEAL